ncbi:hypothetical protein Q3G72_034803 [Acer saccharum]|nr:hypothetical protein Q3G72_026298 [Acer saccharum]KAK1561130.1 hypothetical protein Q3G72_034803 [Acer saccharum]
MHFGDGYNPALCVMLVVKQCVVVITAATGTVYPHYSHYPASCSPPRNSPFPAFVFASSVKATHTTATINLDCHSYSTTSYIALSHPNLQQRTSVIVCVYVDPTFFDLWVKMTEGEED